MNYKEFKKALATICKKHESEQQKLYEQIEDVKRMFEQRKISEKEAWEREMKLASIIDSSKNREKLSTERLKMNFAKQDAPAEIGDIIWATVKGSTRVMKVTEIRLAAFDYPMIKYFGVQLTLHGVPAKVQKVAPFGGIYQKDIISVNGEVYIYKTRE